MDKKDYQYDVTSALESAFEASLEGGGARHLMSTLSGLPSALRGLKEAIRKTI